MESEQDKKLIKELKAMGKVKAPHDFLYRVNSRLEEKPKKTAFPFKLATAGAAFLVIFSIYVLMQPEYQMAFKAPGTKGEKKEVIRSAARRAVVSKKIAKVAAPAKPKPKPKPAPERSAEMALILDAEEDSAVLGAAGGMRGLGFSPARVEPSKPSSFDKVKYIISLVNGKVVDSSSEYITADIPTEKQVSFLEMISQFDDVEKPAMGPTDKETVRLRIKLLPQN